MNHVNASSKQITHFVEAENRNKDKRDEYEVLLRQQLQKWNEKFEESHEIKSRCDNKN